MSDFYPGQIIKVVISNNPKEIRDGIVVFVGARCAMLPGNRERYSASYDDEYTIVSIYNNTSQIDWCSQKIRGSDAIKYFFRKHFVNLKFPQQNDMFSTINLERYLYDLRYTKPILKDKGCLYRKVFLPHVSVKTCHLIPQENIINHGVREEQIHAALEYTINKNISVVPINSNDYMMIEKNSLMDIIDIIREKKEPIVFESESSVLDSKLIIHEPVNIPVLLNVEPGYHSISEVASKLGIGKSTLRHWVKIGGVNEPIRVKNSIYVKYSSVEKYIKDYGYSSKFEYPRYIYILEICNKYKDIENP
jgi:hypothetical protein